MLKVLEKYNSKEQIIRMYNEGIELNIEFLDNTLQNIFFVTEIFNVLIRDIYTHDIENIDGNYQFIIFDAKYYNIQLEHNKKLCGQPGIESVTKQYLYQLAYQPFVEAHQIGTVRNCFLMPSASSEIIEKGAVTLAMLRNLGLQDIQVRLLPAEQMYQFYKWFAVWCSSSPLRFINQINEFLVPHITVLPGQWHRQPQAADWLNICSFKQQPAVLP